MTVLIKDIPKSDRPIERLINNGAEFLSDSEILAILIKTGTREKSAKTIADEILKKYKSLNELKNINLEQLTKIKGIGVTKAVSILAAFELSRRINNQI